MPQPITLVWFRRDLRVFDNCALQTAIRLGLPVVGVFVFDRDILGSLPADDRRMTFIHQCLSELQQALAEKQVPLVCLQGDAVEEVVALALEAGAAHVVCAEDYEPAAIERDTRAAARLVAHECRFHAVKDQVMLAKSEVMTQQEKPFEVFGAYRKAWLAVMADHYAGWQPQDDWASLIVLQRDLPEKWRTGKPVPALSELGFQEQVLLQQGGEQAAQAALGQFMQQMAGYALTRDFPTRRGTSQLSAYLRFGALSVRHLVALARQEDHEGAAAWLSELAWREFFQQLLYHYPTVQHEAFKPNMRRLVWENRPDYLEAWQMGQTGYPLVDAAMRQLRQTGYLHNRLRMVAASFLVKDLLCDWRLGEAWFARQLLDFDLAANNGNWQWVAGTGCDAQPYFRVFNPVLQSQKFDPDGQFIRRHVPELAHLDKEWIHAPWRAAGSIDTHGYPPPIVEHAVQREKVLALFQAARGADHGIMPV